MSVRKCRPFSYLRVSIALYLFLLVMCFAILKSAGDMFSQGNNYAVLRGSTLKMPCLPYGMEAKESGDGVVFAWTDKEGRELVDARFTKLELGTLEIVNAHVGDSGDYKCKVRPPSMHTPSQVYEHKLMVYELSGHKFVSHVQVDASRYTPEVVRSLLKDLLAVSVCRKQLCTPDKVKSLKCEFTETRDKNMCVFTIPYEAVNQIADESCDENCVRDQMLVALRKAEQILESELRRSTDDPSGRLKADMRTFDTKHLITCEPGFHLVKAHFKRCFPCLPGRYSEANSVECNLCPIGTYQEHYGKQDCDKCEDERTTQSMAAKSKDECVGKENTGILSDIREGIVSIFG